MNVTISTTLVFQSAREEEKEILFEKQLSCKSLSADFETRDRKTGP
jgi:hypothetical protein